MLQQLIKSVLPVELKRAAPVLWYLYLRDIHPSEEVRPAIVQSLAAQIEADDHLIEVPQGIELGGRVYLLDGHTRIAALKLLGCKISPVQIQQLNSVGINTWIQRIRRLPPLMGNPLRVVDPEDFIETIDRLGTCGLTILEKGRWIALVLDPGRDLLGNHEENHRLWTALSNCGNPLDRTEDELRADIGHWRNYLRQGERALLFPARLSEAAFSRILQSGEAKVAPGFTRFARPSTTEARVPLAVLRQGDPALLEEHCETISSLSLKWAFDEDEPPRWILEGATT